MKKTLLVIAILAIVLPANFYSQCSLYPVSLSSIINNSSLIIQGKVVSQKSFWNASRNYIYTSNLISVNQTLKGTLNSSFVEVVTEGGQVDLNKQVVDPSLQLNINDEGIFTLNTFNQPSQFGNIVYQVYADQQGFTKFDLKDNTASKPFKSYVTINDVYTEFGNLLNTSFPNFINSTQNRFNASASSITSIGSISPTTITAGTSSILTITGTGFGTTRGSSTVEFKNADDGGSTYILPDPSQYVSWSSTQIQVRVPTKTGTSGSAGTGPIRVTVGTATVSTQILTVSYGELNVSYSNTLTTQTIFNTRHVNLNSAGGITWQMYTSFDANAAAKTAFLSAFQTWRCNTNINWVTGPTVTTNTIALDGIDVIRFDINNELPSGVLGRCSSYFSGCSSGSTFNWFVSELDICFDDPATSAITWNFGPGLATGSQYDFESVTVHELGHGHQLSHVINNADVMHYAIANASNKRALISQNLNAGNDVMSRSTSPGICGKSSMTLLASGLCATSSPTAAFSVTSPVCAGQTIALNSTSAGSPTNYTWTMTGASPTTSTLQNTSTSYASAGIYSITLTVANGFSLSTVTHTISIIASPTIVVTSTTACSGNNGTLTASGATSYTWNPGATSAPTRTFNLTSTQIYTIIGSNGTCTNSATGTASIIATPTISTPNSTVCSGSSVLVTASGASSYTWNPGGFTGSSHTYSPAAAGILTVTGTNGSCLGTKIFTLTLNPTPTVSTNSSNTLVCGGSTITLTASGATNYTFNPGNITTNTVMVNPTSTTIYTVSGATNGCIGNSIKTISVIATPSIIVTSASVCSGNTATLNVSGGASYTWNPGALSGTTHTFNLTSTQIYTVIGSNGTCTNSSMGTLSVNPNPTVSTNASILSICAGQTTTLTASGAANYTFNPGAIVGNPVTVSPTSNTTYTAIGKTNNCSGTSIITISVSVCTDINKISTNSDFKIYPNPTQGQIIINFNGKYTGQLNLYNSLGQLIISQKINETEKLDLNLSDYSKGVYLIKLTSNQGKETINRILKD